MDGFKYFILLQIKSYDSDAKLEWIIDLLSTPKGIELAEKIDRVNNGNNYITRLEKKMAIPNSECEENKNGFLYVQNVILHFLGNISLIQIMSPFTYGNLTPI